MQKNYKPIGDYIQLVDKRNTDLAVTQLVGLTINKEFIPSVANTIGSNMANYKIIRQNQFACSLMQVRRDKKIPVALYRESEPAIISQAYPVFEIIDTDILLPEYLMMWFSRSEFDREACFYAVGGVRGSLEWDDFCKMQLPVPSPARQQEVVDEYNAVQRRITLNEQLCQKLEETAQALYRKYFVDDIDPENLPEGWRYSSLDKIADYLNGLACQNFETNSDIYFPVIKIRELNQGFTDLSSNKVKKSIPTEYVINNGDVIFSWSGTLMIDFWCGNQGALNQHLFKVTSNKYDKWFYYLWTKSHIENFKRLISAKATSMGHIKREDLSNAEVLVPSKIDLSEMNKTMSPIFNMLIFNKKEILKLKELLSLLLAKMGR